MHEAYLIIARYAETKGMYSNLRGLLSLSTFTGIIRNKRKKGNIPMKSSVRKRYHAL